MPQIEASRERTKKRARLDVSSPAFREGERIPERFTADGANLSPVLCWSDPPPSTKSLAVLCEDPDAPSGVFVHWVVWDIRADERQLQEGIPHTADPSNLRQGQNGFGGTGYAGPKPPPGKPHRYVFHVYALDAKPDLTAGATRAELDRLMDRHVVAEGTLTGMYGR